MSQFLAPSPARAVEARSEQPRFSIVITAYEAAVTIPEAVRSALDQTYPAYEVIVVDDGSEDDLRGALAPFGDRISVMRKPNGGGASARNAGAAAAAGNFMAILDADDSYDPRRLEALAELSTARPDLDLLATDARFVVDGCAVGSFLAHNPFPTVRQREAIFRSCFPSGWPAVRLSALAAAGGFDERMRIAYDWDCWLRMILRGSSVGMVAEPLYDYVLHGGSLASARLASLRERVVLLEKAKTNPSLRRQERRPLNRALRGHRAAVARTALDLSLADDARRADVARLALAKDADPRTRALAILATVSPATARRRADPEHSPERRFGAAPR